MELPSYTLRSFSWGCPWTTVSKWGKLGVEALHTIPFPVLTPVLSSPPSCTTQWCTSDLRILFLELHSQGLTSTKVVTIKWWWCTAWQPEAALVSSHTPGGSSTMLVTYSCSRQQREAARNLTLSWIHWIWVPWIHLGVSEPIFFSATAILSNFCHTDFCIFSFNQKNHNSVDYISNAVVPIAKRGQKIEHLFERNRNMS